MKDNTVIESFELNNDGLNVDEIMYIPDEDLGLNYYGSEHDGNPYGSTGNMGKDNLKSNNVSRDEAASMDSTGKRKSFRRLLSRFAEKTSMVGVPYINHAKFWWAKLIWCFCLLVAMAAMGLHLWYLFDQFFSWPKQTKIALGFDTLNFPEVTICNTNVMHRGRLDTFGGAVELKLLIEALSPEMIAPDQFDPNYDPLAPATDSPPLGKRRKRAIDSYGNLNLSKYDENNIDWNWDDSLNEGDFDGSVDMQTQIDALFTELYMDVGKKNRAYLGHNITDMLLSCTFAGRQCTPGMFQIHQTSQYGNCWSLKSNKFRATKSGPEGGLTLYLYLEVNEYLKGITSGYGIRAQIHQRGIYPYPDQEGIFIPASMETDVGLRMTSVTRLDGNYGNCETGDIFLDKYKMTYSRRACQTVCYAEKIIDSCACYVNTAEEFSRKINDTLRRCRTQKEINCMSRVTKNFDSETQCTCVNPCNEITYTKRTSQRQWPTEEYAMILLDSVCSRDKDVCKTLRDKIDDISFMSNNFLKLNIYYEDLNFENITEEPEIEVQQFLSDVGGAIGLWIGLSMLSLCEVVQLFVEMCDYGCHKTIRERRQDRKKRRKQQRKQEAADRELSNRYNHDDEKWPRTDFRSNKSNENKLHPQNGFGRHPEPNGDVRHENRYHGYRDDVRYARSEY